MRTIRISGGAALSQLNLKDGVVLVTNPNPGKARRMQVRQTWGNKTRHKKMASSATLEEKFSLRVEIQLRPRVSLRAFAKMVIERSDAGKFLLENSTCRDFTTTQLNDFNQLYHRYKPQTGSTLSGFRIESTESLRYREFSCHIFPIETHPATYRNT